jgi:hypothetical protein
MVLERLEDRTVPSAATHFAVSAPANATAGTPFAITVSALDAANQADTGYTGIVHFTASAGSHVLPLDYTFTAADHGAYTFTGVTLGIAGSETVTAADKVTPSISGVVSVRVAPGAATSFALSAPSTATAGVPFGVTVTALDNYGNVASGYTGSVHFISNDLAPVLPGDYTFTAADRGKHTFAGVTLTSALGGSIRVQDTLAPSIYDSTVVDVSPGPVVQFTFVNPYPNGPGPGLVEQQAGLPFTLTVTAEDAYGNTAVNYTGTVHFTTWDTSNTLPADYTFTAADGGIHSFSFTFTQILGTLQTITVTDTATSVRASADVQIDPGPAASFVLGSPDTTTAGSPFSVTVRALDAYGNEATDYGGTVHLSSSDPLAVLPADYSFKPSDATGDGGFHAFDGLVLSSPGSQTITASDPGEPGLSGSITVNVAPAANVATHFAVSAPSAATAGTPFSVTVTALDQNGNVVPGYTGTVHFTASAGSHVLPADYTFTAADAGVHTFTGVSLGIAGAEMLTVADKVTPSVAGTAAVRVSPAAATHFALSAPASATAETPFSVTLTALDPYGNVATGYTGRVHFTASAGSHVLPADYTFTAADHGAHTFSGLTLGIAGTETVTVTDTAAATLTGKASVRVTPGPGSNVVVSAPSIAGTGMPFSVTLTAYDQFGNLATGYSATVHFASSDGTATLPADYTFVAADAGKHTFTGIVLNQPGNQTLTISDALTSGVLARVTIPVAVSDPPTGTGNPQPAPSALVSGPAATTLDPVYAQLAAPQNGHPAARTHGKKHNRRHHA